MIKINYTTEVDEETLRVEFECPKEQYEEILRGLLNSRGEMHQQWIDPEKLK